MLLLCLFLFNITFSQEAYYVTLVKGVITRQDKARVKIGDKLHADEKLRFSSKDCRLVMLHPQKGRFVLETANVIPETTGEYLMYIKSNLNLNSQRLQLSSRGASRINLDDYFTADESVNDKILFIGVTKIGLEPAGYILDDPLNDFFFLQHIDASGKIYRNKLKVINDTLYIFHDDFKFNGNLSVEGLTVMPAFSRYTKRGEQVTYFHSFKPVFISLSDCREIMKTVKLAAGDRKDKIINETMTQLYFNYGKPDKDALIEIYESL